jgi:hypothetical protein
MTTAEVIDHVMTVRRVIVLLTVPLGERCGALIIVGHEQHGLPFSRSHGEGQLAEFFRPVSENASFVRTHSRSCADHLLNNSKARRVPLIEVRYNARIAVSRARNGFLVKR